MTRERRDGLQAHVLHALRDAGVTADQRLGVGCSGGPDSAALAHATLALSRQGAVGPVVLVHVDHGLRPGSARDVDVVRALAERGGGALDVRAVAVDRAGASLERAARDARYQALERAAGDHGLARVLLAHTASDQAETVLMRVLRGTGVAGLAGIPRRRGIYLRPLLAISRARIETYVAEHGIDTVDDPMNRDAAFFRSRVRHHWLPALAAENPRLEDALCRLAGSAQRERDVVDAAARLLIASATREEGLCARALADAPAPVLARALAMAVASAGGGPTSARHLEALAALVRRPAAGTVSLDLPGLVAVREYDVLALRAAGAAGALPADPAGTSRAGAAGADVPARADVSVTGPDQPYVVRRWQPGDRMRPARLKGRSRKLSDLFIDAKVPLRLRRQAVVVARRDDGVIEWAQHIGPAWDSRARVVLTSPDPAASNKVTE